MCCSATKDILSWWGQYLKEISSSVLLFYSQIYGESQNIDYHHGSRMWKVDPLFIWPLVFQLGTQVPSLLIFAHKRVSPTLLSTCYRHRSYSSLEPSQQNLEQRFPHIMCSAHISLKSIQMHKLPHVRLGHFGLLDLLKSGRQTDACGFLRP